MFKDFRGYLDYLEKQDKLLRVQKEVDTRFEIAAGIRKISDNDGPALLFENIREYPDWRVAGGVYATQKLIALALGLPIDADEESMVKHYLDCFEKRVKPKPVASGPVKEVIIKGDDIDLTKLPVPIFSELDSGHFLTAGVEVSKHPETGIQNVSIARRKILGKDRTAILAQEPQQLGMLVTAAEKKGQGLPVATVIGAEPSFTIASVCRPPLGVDETYIAGAFRGEPVEVVKCETIDVEVPANAEIVIEGVTIPHERAVDGPFGEFPGNYITLIGEPVSNVPVVKVTAITMRKNPIFQVMLTGMPMTENHTLKKWSYTASAYQLINKIADLKALNLTPGGTAHYHIIVAINKKDDLEPKNIIDTLVNAHLGLTYVMVVDDDIDVYDPADVEWAMATRMWADEDIIVIPGVPRAEGVSKFAGSKLGIDATAPLKDRQWYVKAKVPGVEKVDYV